MKRIGRLLVVLVMAGSPLFSQNVHIPDGSFLKALVDRGVDANGDGAISYAEAENVSVLELAFGEDINDRISDFTGLEAFSYLLRFDCSGHGISNLDIWANRRVAFLDCSHNNIGELDLSRHTRLVRLDCQYNSIESLELSANGRLEYLSCGKNLLKALDVSGNPVLKHLACFWNQIPALDVSGNAGLEELYCMGNSLTTLDLSANTMLTGLNCADNLLTDLDLSNNPELEYLVCGRECEHCTWLGNYMTELDLSANKKIKTLKLNLMSALQDVCVWTAPFPVEGMVLETAGSPNISFTTACGEDCLYIPDMAFYRELVYLGVDANRDGCITSMEAEAVTVLELGYATDLYAEISDFTGLEAFVNLERLDCSNHGITSLDVSENPALTYLDCGYNSLIGLDLSKNLNLKTLHCWSSGLEELDVSANTLLEILYCGWNMLGELDLSGNSVLRILECPANNLSGITLPEASNLRLLNCARNQIGQLDLSHQDDLSYLDCRDNQLTAVDLSGNWNLWGLYAGNHWGGGNRLTTLDLSRNSGITSLSLTYLPTLYKVCVWTDPFPPSGVRVTTQNSPHVWFSSGCTGSKGSFGPVVGQQMAQQNRFRIFPNPAGEQVTIAFSEQGPHTFELISAGGALIRSGTVTGNLHTIDLFGVPEGIYLVRITMEDAVITQRLMRRY